MHAMQIPDEASRLAAKYELGEPVRVYRTEKRPQLKLLGWVMALTSLVVLVALLIQAPFRFTPFSIALYSLMLALLLFVTLLFLLPLLFMRQTTVYICSAGFIVHRKTSERIVRWEEVEWVSSENKHCVVYLANKQRVIMSRLMGHLEMLAQEIEFKARLVRRPEGRETLEIQFAHLLRSQAARLQEKEDRLRQKQPFIKEEAEEAFKLQEEYRLGEMISTYHGGFKGLVRQKAIGMSIHYLLLLTFLFLSIGLFLHFRFFPGGAFLATNAGLLYLGWFFLFSFFTPRFSARFFRLHVYTEGFVSFENGSCEVVRWEQVEKVIYHKTTPVLSPPLCHLYLTNGDTLTINGYIHERRAVKQIFNEHVIPKVEAG